MTSNKKEKGEGPVKGKSQRKCSFGDLSSKVRDANLPQLRLKSRKGKMSSLVSPELLYSSNFERVPTQEGGEVDISFKNPEFPEIKLTVTQKSDIFEICAVKTQNQNPYFLAYTKRYF